MTVPSTTRRAGPFTGNGVTTSFPFSFKVFGAADIALSIANASGVAQPAVLNQDYLVTLNVDQTVSPGGSVQYAVAGVATALPAGYTLAITGSRALAQTVTLPTGGAYQASVVEAALDSLEMQIQQIDEATARALALSPLTPGGVDRTLPAPAPNKLIGWNSDASALQNADPATLATIVAYGTARRDIFTGTGSQTQFTLSNNPGAQANLDVDISGVTQRGNGLDFTWTGGTTLTFTSPPPAGASIQVRYFQGLPQGTADAAAVSYLPAGTGATGRTAQDKLREFVSVLDFGADPTGAVDSTTAIQNALNASLRVYVPSGTYLVTGLTLRYGHAFVGASRFDTWIKSVSNAPIITFGGAEAGGSNVGFVTISDMRLLGVATAGTSQHGIRVVPQQSFIDVSRVHIVAPGGNGIDFRGTVTSAGNDQWTVRDCKIEQAAGYGVAADTQLATSIFENVECYANALGGWSLQSTAGYKLDNNLFVRCHTRNSSNPGGGVANGWTIGSGVQNCTWINSWCESNGNTAGNPDTNRVSAGWKINTGANAHLTFIGCKNSVQSRGFWITGNTTGVELRAPSFLLMSQFRSSADILVDAGSAAEIINPVNQSNPLVISIVDGQSTVRYQGVAIPGATTRVARGSEYRFTDGSTSRALVGGATAGTFGGGTWSGTAGTNTITGSTGHSLRIGDHVRIPGAGTAGATLEAYITSMNATDLVATLDRNIVTTVAAAAMSNGDRLMSNGTFTALAQGATNGLTGATYTTQTGTYQIDDAGYASGNINLVWTGHTGTGVCLLTLPFTVAETAIPSISSNIAPGAGLIPLAAANAATSWIQVNKLDPATGTISGQTIAAAATVRASFRFKITLPV